MIWILLACIVTITVLVVIVVKQNIRIGALNIADKRRKETEKKLLAQITKYQTADKQKPLSEKTNPQTFKLQGAMQLLNLFQSKSRIVDFAYEDISRFSDEKVGAVARIVHQGLHKVISEQFTLERILVQDEGKEVTYEAMPDASLVRIRSEQVIEYPCTFKVIHPGWKITKTSLPEVIDTFRFDILKNAEVEKH